MRPTLPILALLAFLPACEPSKTPAALMEGAAGLQARGELRAAVIQLRNAVQADPNNPVARRQLAGVYLEQGDGAAAEKELRRAAALQADPALAVLIARSLVLQGKHAEAIAHLLDAGPSAMADAVRGQAHLASGETTAAGRAFESALAQDQKCLPAILGLGQLALLAGDAAQAGRRSGEALALYPREPEALRFAAALDIEGGRHEQALVTLRQVLALRPGDAHSHLDVAKLLIDGGKFSEAQASIEAARRSASGGLHIVHTLALLEFRQGRYAEAREHLQQILKAAPDYPPALLLSGAIELSLGTGQLAITHLEKFLSTHPGHAHGSRLLGAAHLQARQPVAAAQVAAQALEKHPDDAELLAIAGEAALRQGKHAEAAGLFNRASSAAPGKPALRMAAGISSLGAGDAARAIAELEGLPPSGGLALRSGAVLVLSHLKARRPDAALAVLAKLERNGPDPFLLNLKGAAQVAAGQPEAARANFDAALALDPAHLPALDNLAQLDLMQAKPGAARQRYQAALARMPKDPALLESAARLETHLGNIGAARTLLERSAGLQPHSVPAALRLAEFLFHAGDAAKALALVRTTLANHPDSLDALALLAQLQRKSRQYAAASDSYAQLAAIAPARDQALLMQATVQVEGKDFAGAHATLDKILAQRPDHVEAHALRAVAFGAQGKLDQALATARQVQRQRPKSGAGFQMEGDVHMAAKRWREAVAAYQAGLAVHQDGVLVRLLHGALLKDGRHMEAERRLADWARKHPEDADTRLYYASSLAAAGRFAGARAELESLVRLRPADPIVLNELALAYHQSGDKRALATAMQALALAPDSANVLDTAGWLNAEQGKPADALRLLRRATTLQPSNVAAGMHLAAALLRAGDKAAARRELDRVAQLDPAIATRREVKALRAAL